MKPTPLEKRPTPKEFLGTKKYRVVGKAYYADGVVHEPGSVVTLVNRAPGSNMEPIDEKVKGPAIGVKGG